MAANILLLTTFDAIKDYLEYNNEEGLVFWLDGQPLCKIKRSDFGFPWPIKSSKRCGNGEVAKTRIEDAQRQPRQQGLDL